MESVQLWLLDELSWLSGAGGLGSAASDFPPRTWILLPPPSTTPGIQSRKEAKGDLGCRQLSPPLARNGRGIYRVGCNFVHRSLGYGNWRSGKGR